MKFSARIRTERSSLTVRNADENRKRKNTKKVSHFLLINEQMFCIIISVILLLYAGKARKLNIGVNIFSGLHARQRGGRLTELPHTFHCLRITG